MRSVLVLNLIPSAEDKEDDVASEEEKEEGKQAYSLGESGLVLVEVPSKAV